MSDLSRTTRGELLAVADATALKQMAQRCLTAGIHARLIGEPTTGLVMMRVRQPIAHDSFYLDEALVTTAEVAIEDHEGWSMRLGDDRATTLAAAICDAVVECGHPLGVDVEALCHQTRDARSASRAGETVVLAPTAVQFEELN